MVSNLVIIKLQEADKIPYDLLLLADPSRENVDKYIFNSAIYLANSNGSSIGCYVLCPLDNNTIEIKNIAVAIRHQAKGLGTHLLHDAMEKSKIDGFKKIVIGTGNSSTRQLNLYQKLGFKITAIKSDYFRDNYDEPIFENGTQCTDMIVLTKEL